MLLAYIEAAFERHRRHDGTVPSSHLIYLAEAPEWEPELLINVEPSDAKSETLWRAGRSVDGRIVYFWRHTSGSRSRRLWAIDTSSRAARFIADVPRVGSMVLPSPNGTYLALVHPGISDYPDRRYPLTVIDCGDDSVHALTWHTDPGAYSDSALAWSANVPGRLYFIDLLGRAWQLDMRLPGMPGTGDVDARPDG